MAEETQGSGGLEGASDDRLDELCDEYSMRYLTEELGGLEGKSARFAYLFARLAESVRRIVQDMAEELRASEFKPLSFELDLSRPGLLPRRSCRTADGCGWAAWWTGWTAGSTAAGCTCG